VLKNKAMSTNYYSSLVVGAVFKEIVIEHKQEVTVTKYNEDTGVPYSCTTSHSKTFLGNIEIEIDDSLEETLEEYDLELHYTHCEQEEAERIIGIKIYESSEPAIIEVDIDLLQRETKDLATEFNELGISVKPKLFLIHSVG
jgi:hypothetical protein